MNRFIADELYKLKDLKDAGILSEEEFAAQKAKLLENDSEPSSNTSSKEADRPVLSQNTEKATRNHPTTYSDIIEREIREREDKERESTIASLSNPMPWQVFAVTLSIALAFTAGFAWAWENSHHGSHGWMALFCLLGGLLSWIVFFCVISMEYNRDKELTIAKRDFKEYKAYKARQAMLAKEEEDREHPVCPNCKKRKTERITTTSRALSVSAYGLASDEIGKTFKCKNCGYKW